MNQENTDYLSTQIVTYLGNKRALLPFIEKALIEVQKRTGKEKLKIGDLFSGTGIVSRLFKKYSELIIVNDLEEFSRILNSCYLSNKSNELINILNEEYKELKYNIQYMPIKGFISDYYSPKDEDNISKNDRVFYTKKNALIIDSFCSHIKKFDSFSKNYFLAPLLSEASIHVNTSGIFKGFHKNKLGIGHYGGVGENALSRIKSDIKINFPVFSNFYSDYKIYKEDSNSLVDKLEELDLIYIDPPYNQHPYGSNYFMLNLISTYEKPSEISKVSGIPKNWNRSSYNNKMNAEESLFELIEKCNSKFVLISYNSEGFINYDNFKYKLEKLGKLNIYEQDYSTYKGSRNLNERNLKVKEYLFLLEKR